MAKGAIHRLIDCFDEISADLVMDLAPEKIEHYAVFVNNVMSYQSRQFHTIDHVFGFFPGADAVTKLAAVFHDLIYYQVDQGFQGEAEALLRPFLLDVAGGLVLNPESFKAQPWALTLCKIFGYQPNQTLNPFSGLNEFLSALLMNCLLTGKVPEAILAETAACIEASVPFRGPEATSVFDSLFSRLTKLNLERAWGWDESKLQAVVKRAVDFANKDVEDFKLDDTSAFLSNTWKLLPELNSSLRSKGAFTIREYRIAMQKMEGFFSSLKPATVYHAFADSPRPQQIEEWVAKVERNLAIAREYMQAKLLAAGLLEALAFESGGDTPISLFMGDIPAPGQHPERLEDYLPNSPLPEWLTNENPVYRLLRDGRLGESDFDLKNSPLANFIYEALSPEEFQAHVTFSRDYFTGKIDALAYLQKWKSSCRKAVAIAASKLVGTRTVKLKKLADDF